MQLGRMRHVAQVQKPTFTRDPRTNQKIATFATIAKIRGLLQPLRGREAVNAKQIKAEITAVFITRFQCVGDVIDEAMQLVIEGEIWKISAVIDVNFRHNMLEIYCTQVTVPNQ